MIIDLGGRPLAESRAIVKRALDAMKPKNDAPKPRTVAQNALERARMRAKVAGTTKMRAAILSTLERLQGTVLHAIGLREADDGTEDEDPTTKEQVDEALAAVDAWPADAFSAAIDTIVRELYTQGGESAGAELNVSFSLVPQAAIDALLAGEGTLSKTFVDRERIALRALLLKALTDGIPVRELAQQIRDFFDDGIHYVDKAGAVERTLPSDSWAEMVARTEVSRAFNAGQMATYKHNGVDRIRWLTAEDERVCFPETTTVSVNGRDVPIREVASCVDTPRGLQDIVAWSKRQHTGDWVAFEAAGRTSLATCEHPFWASGAWREAWTLQVGDVVQTASNELVEIDRIAYIALGYSYGEETPVPEELVAFAIASRDARKTVPVVAVDLDDDIARDQEVDVVPADALLANRHVSEPGEGCGDELLDARLSDASAVATSRTERRHVAGADSLLLAARSARGDRRGSSAALGTVGTLGVALSAETRTTSNAILVDRSGQATCPRAHSVSMRLARWDGERLTALRAPFFHVLDEPLARATIWATFCRRGLATDATESARAREVRGGALSSALLAFSDHRHDETLKKFGIDVPTVYNFHISPDELFFADGVLVHNCPECDDLEGVVTAVGDTFPDTDVTEPPLHPSCRCTTVGVRPGEAE